jgi:energy-coupling factor transporter ATP-binding protein EcfA2
MRYTPCVGFSPGSRSPRSVPVYFCSLDVEDIRCFAGRQRLDLTHDGRPAKWTVLLGDNGVGKTTLLQCLYSLAPHPVWSEDGEIICARGLGDDDLPSARMGRERGTIEASLRVGKRLDEPEGGIEDGGKLDMEGSVGIASSGYGSMLDDYLSSLCCGYGASRRIGHGGLESGTLHESGSSLFSPESPLINAVEWLLQADYAAQRTGGARAIHRRDAVKQALIDMLPDVSAIREAGFDDVPARPRIDVQTPYGWVSLRDLSLGYQALIAWVVDLANRMFEAYADSENPLAEAAVVLVDELDLHLHPRWQREITSYLDRLFPNVQFIVTAHSPLVVQASGVTNVAVLRRNGDHVEILNDPEEVRGWRVDQILTSDLFGLDSARPVDVERALERHRELILLDDLTQADQQELRELDTRLSKLPAGELARDREAWTIAHELARQLQEAADSKP